jgi:hypothetical protein
VLRDRKLKGQLAVKEKLYGQSAKAAAKAEQVPLFLSLHSCGFLQNVYITFGLQNMQVGVSLEMLPIIMNIRY